jgi:hypothetical protein
VNTAQQIKSSNLFNPRDSQAGRLVVAPVDGVTGQGTAFHAHRNPREAAIF